VAAADPLARDDRVRVDVIEWMFTKYWGSARLTRRACGTAISPNAPGFATDRRRAHALSSACGVREGVCYFQRCDPSTRPTRAADAPPDDAR
jgi:hypothetical protein